MRRLVYFVPVVLFLGVAAYLLSGLFRDPQQLPSALIGEPAPQFDLPPIEGHVDGSEAGFSTADLRRGRISIVNVFASWCLPCRIEHPIIERLSRSTGVPVYGLNYKDKPEDARAWLQELGDPYAAIGADRDGRVGIDWGVYGVPETFVVDGAGIIRYRYPGPLSPEVVESEIAPLIRDLKG